MGTTVEHEEMKKNRQIFHNGRMPCCGGSVRSFMGPQSGLCINIKCAHCEVKWNVGPATFERIG